LIETASPLLAQTGQFELNTTTSGVFASPEIFCFQSLFVGYSRGDLLQALTLLDEEEDVNKVLKYFSYEHFYVIYCKVRKQWQSCTQVFLVWCPHIYEILHKLGFACTCKIVLLGLLKEGLLACNGINIQIYGHGLYFSGS
jgi:hypothetical protein